LAEDSLISTSLHNLPTQLIPIVGREKEIGDLIGLLKNPEIRLITLHGFGGTGKTRLAVETGHAALDLFPDGVWFVALAPLGSPEHIVTATAAALGFSFQSHKDQQRQLIHFLQSKKTLLIFDNLEHLLPESTSLVEEIQQHLPETRLLVTSRQPLNAPWEMVYPLHGLDYETSPSSLNRDMPAAAQLFLQHLSRVAGPSEGRTGSVPPKSVRSLGGCRSRCCWRQVGDASWNVMRSFRKSSAASGFCKPKRKRSRNDTAVCKL